MKLYMCRMNSDNEYKIIEVKVLKETPRRYYLEDFDLNGDRGGHYKLVATIDGYYIDKINIDCYMFRSDYLDPSQVVCRIISTSKTSRESMRSQLFLNLEKRLRYTQYEISKLQQKQLMITNKLNNNFKCYKKEIRNYE